MKVYLAGYNVDTHVLNQLQQKAGERNDITPEVLSAAYARISRDPRPIDEIRSDARKEVERSRKSNTTIIFKMGHHSVAEHAVFNLDIIEVSRLAMEELERFRLCSYTEKSQRYITLGKSYIVPDEIRARGVSDIFIKMADEQNAAYARFFEKLKKHVFLKFPELAENRKKHSLLEGWAKEDARYITPLATHAQVGMTINARSLELLLRRFASNPLQEIKELGKTLYEKVSSIAPSVIIFHETNDRDAFSYHDIKQCIDSFLSRCPARGASAGTGLVRLVESTEKGDILLAASLLHSSTTLSYEECKAAVARMKPEELIQLFKSSWRHMQFYDTLLREFEYVNLTYDITLSAACFGQLKRHRMTTITTQAYDPELGVTVPSAITDAGLESQFKEIIDKTNDVYRTIRRKAPLAAPYILTNAHRRRVLLRLNARELYHISRLREDAHAQWDIRSVSTAMTREAKKVMPLTFMLVGGKDRYNEIYHTVFGALPRVTEAALPGTRMIQRK